VQYATTETSVSMQSTVMVLTVLLWKQKIAGMYI